MGIGNPQWVTNTHLSPPNHQSTFISRIFSSIFTIPIDIGMYHHNDLEMSQWTFLTGKFI